MTDENQRAKPKRGAVTAEDGTIHEFEVVEEAGNVMIVRLLATGEMLKVRKATIQ